ncbi:MULTISPECIES: Imm32 family immunity protein [Shewanella]|uniref:Imm32 family immunity protein n=1 Tax=Shewanella TaxID=22 RepID=UPI00014B8B38
MKFWGYTQELAEAAEPQPKALIEVTISATPSDLREIAKFLSSAADKIEVQGRNFEHEHFLNNASDAPRLIVFNPLTLE